MDSIGRIFKPPLTPIMPWLRTRFIKKLIILFSPVPIRYLKLVQLGKDPVYWWSIYEVEVYKK